MAEAYSAVSGSPAKPAVTSGELPACQSQPAKPSSGNHTQPLPSPPIPPSHILWGMTKYFTQCICGNIKQLPQGQQARVPPLLTISCSHLLRVSIDNQLAYICQGFQVQTRQATSILSCRTAEASHKCWVLEFGACKCLRCRLKTDMNLCGF